MVAILPIVLTACTAAPAREAARVPPTLVSLNPCTDAILAEVADPDQLLAISSYSRDPASSSMDPATARSFRAVGGSVEEVLALKPDLVVGSTFMSPATSGALTRLGFRLEQVGIAPTVEDSKAQIRHLAALAGHPERGAALIARIDAALLRAAPPVGKPVGAIVWQAGGIVPGPGTLISDLLTRTGFANAAAARGMKQADFLPLEVLLSAPPQLILTAGDPRANGDRMLNHPALAALTGTRRAQIDPALLWCGGPTIIRAVERLAALRRGLVKDPPPPTPSSEEEGALKSDIALPLHFRGGGRRLVARGEQRI